MTVYKPGTQLIITDLWAAIAARTLGFELDSGRIHWDKKTEFWNTGFSVSADKWRIPVTESGPNAAERFLPQVFDVVMLGENDAMRSIGEIDDGTYYSPCGDFWPLSEVKRIIERNGIPFPQFSEVIEL